MSNTQCQIFWTAWSHWVQPAMHSTTIWAPQNIVPWTPSQDMRNNRFHTVFQSRHCIALQWFTYLQNIECHQIVLHIAHWGSISDRCNPLTLLHYKTSLHSGSSKPLRSFQHILRRPTCFSPRVFSGHIRCLLSHKRRKNDRSCSNGDNDHSSPPACQA